MWLVWAHRTLQLPTTTTTPPCFPQWFLLQYQPSGATLTQGAFCRALQVQMGQTYLGVLHCWQMLKGCLKQAWGQVLPPCSGETARE